MDESIFRNEREKYAFLSFLGVYEPELHNKRMQDFLCSILPEIHSIRLRKKSLVSSSKSESSDSDIEFKYDKWLSLISDNSSVRATRIPIRLDISWSDKLGIVIFFYGRTKWEVRGLVGLIGSKQAFRTRIMARLRVGNASKAFMSFITTLPTKPHLAIPHLTLIRVLKSA